VRAQKQNDVQRWTTKRKAALVLSFLKGKPASRKQLYSTD
jgi:hypothetical protein